MWIRKSFKTGHITYVGPRGYNYDRLHMVGSTFSKALQLCSIKQTETISQRAGWSTWLPFNFFISFQWLWHASLKLPLNRSFTEKPENSRYKESVYISYIRREVVGEGYHTHFQQEGFADWQEVVADRCSSSHCSACWLDQLQPEWTVGRTEETQIRIQWKAIRRTKK